MNKPHLIITNARSGSNFLVNSLNLHDNVVNYGEVLGHWTAPEKMYKLAFRHFFTREKYLGFLLRQAFPFYLGQAASALSHLRDSKKVNFKKRSEIKSIGFKDFAVLLDKYSLKEYLRDELAVQVIHLYRSNYLERYISWLKLEATNVAKTEGSSGLKEIVVPTQDLIAQLDHVKYQEDLAKSLAEFFAEKSNVVSVEYEDYFSSPTRMKCHNDAICDLLGVKRLSETSSYKKMAPERLEDSITNYDQVVNALSGSPYEKFLG